MPHILTYTHEDKDVGLRLDLRLHVEIDPGMTDQPACVEKLKVEVTGFRLILANTVLDRSARFNPPDKWAAMALARQFEARLANDSELQERVEEYCLVTLARHAGADY